MYCQQRRNTIGPAHTRDTCSRTSTSSSSSRMLYHALHHCLISGQLVRQLELSVVCMDVCLPVTHTSCKHRHINRHALWQPKRAIVRNRSWLPDRAAACLLSPPFHRSCLLPLSPRVPVEVEQVLVAGNALTQHVAGDRLPVEAAAAARAQCSHSERCQAMLRTGTTPV